ncbi:DUF3006 domain-containing protein [Haloprofundus salinisoli]|uniref:DUF3006 domain-containing protein n=1 Tax=Haloprofundus salinisoli TaxID=2876193 RepID=UPI001CCD2176|nr:DUF3006 domain-containing protein [Haloprofundus salinisoli]
MDESTLLVVDRFEGDDAVLLVEEDGELVDELVLPTAMLPTDGQHQDAIFSLGRPDDTRVELRYDAEMTGERRQSAQNRFDQLSQRLPEEDPDGDSDEF